MFDNTLVSSFARKSSVVCLSSNEAEIISSNESMKELAYYKKAIEELVSQTFECRLLIILVLWYFYKRVIVSVISTCI